MTMRASAAVAIAFRRQGVSGLAAGIAAAIRRRVSIHLTRRTLDALSDEILKDVGVTRCEIDFIAASTRRGECRGRGQIAP